ncbi:ABC transporter ATP-binding protein [Granulosicoccus sp. 3-233]
MLKRPRSASTLPRTQQDTGNGVVLSIDSVTRRFGAEPAVDRLSLNAEPGECIVVLGASGCGKSTLLRMVAGLERADEGTISLDGNIVSGPRTFTPTEERGVGVVFQSYALWPHLDVAAHARFPLDAAGMRGTQARRQVAEALEMVGLQDLADRRPAELSGGQRQRVALARCLAQSARLILMDEPLANLDPHLRGTMEHEINRVRHDTGATMLYITHDQREAMALADRIAVLDNGRLQQISTPEQLYREPANRTVAGFIGSGCFLDARLVGQGLNADQTLEVDIGGRIIPVRARARPDHDKVLLLVRPEDVRLSDATASADRPTARVMSDVYRGDHHELGLQLHSGQFLQARSRYGWPQGIEVSVDISDAWLVPA